METTEKEAPPTGRPAVWGLMEFLRLKEPQRRVALYATAAVAAGVLLLLALGEMGRRSGPAGGVLTPGGLPGSGAPAGAAEVAGASGGGAEAAPAGDPVALMERDLALSLEQILAQVAGVGRVRVQVTLAGALERDYVSDRTVQRTTTQERDQAGGSRVVTQAEETDKVVAVQGGRGLEPVLHQLRRPEVRGVLVVAEGADDPLVEAGLARAVQAALDIPLHRVTVLPGKPASLSGPES